MFKDGQFIPSKKRGVDMSIFNLFGVMTNHSPELSRREVATKQSEWLCAAGCDILVSPNFITINVAALVTTRLMFKET